MRVVTVTGAAAILLSSALAGCASNPLTEAPEGLDVSIYQTRFDANARQLQFHLKNSTGDAITITSARLDSPLFTGPVSWQGESTLPDGRARDLKAPLADAACPPDAVTATVTIDFVLPDGREGTATVTPGDPMDILPQLTAADCLQAAVDRHAGIGIVSVEAGPEPGAPARMTLRITPTGADGELHLRTIEGTNLLALLSDEGEQVDERMIDLTISADSAEQLLVLELEPTRCDPHAVAEDKQGTLFPVTFSTSEGEEGKVRVVAPDAVRSQLYRFVGEFCGF